MAAALAFAVVWLALLVTGCGIAAAAMERSSLRGLAMTVAGFDVICVAVVIALQSLDVVPTVKL